MAQFTFAVSPLGFSGTVDVDTTNMVVTNEILSGVPLVSASMKTQGRSSWWLTRTKLSRGVYLNFSAFPLSIASSLTTLGGPPRREDYILTDLHMSGWEARQSNHAQAVALYWLDSALSPVPGTTSVTINGIPVTAQVHTITGYDGPISSFPSPAVIRSVYVPYSVIAGATPTPLVTLVISVPGYGPATVSFDQVQQLVGGASFPTYTLSPALLSAVDRGWFDVFCANFPTFSMNNEHMPTPPLVYAPEVGRIDKWFGRALFFDGPGYLVSGTPTLDAIAIWWLEQLLSPPTVPAISVSANLMPGVSPLPAFDTYIESRTSLVSPAMSNLIIRTITIPYSSL